MGISLEYGKTHCPLVAQKNSTWYPRRRSATGSGISQFVYVKSAVLTCGEWVSRVLRQNHMTINGVLVFTCDCGLIKILLALGIYDVLTPTRVAVPKSIRFQVQCAIHSMRVLLVYRPIYCWYMSTDCAAHWTSSITPIEEVLSEHM